MANQNNTQIVPFSWVDISLDETVFIDNIPHFTRKTMGVWIEFSSPKDGVSKAIKRQPSIENHSSVVHLSTKNTPLGAKDSTVRVYHPIAFLMIVMGSTTEKAKRMKEAVAVFVWHCCEMGLLEADAKSSIKLDQNELRLTALAYDKATSALAKDMLFQHMIKIGLALNYTISEQAKLEHQTAMTNLLSDGGES